MFKSIKISNYKNIKELEIYKLPKILLIGGKNNVGKSTLLEAFFLVLDRLNPNLISRHFGWRGIHPTSDPDYWWRPSFHNFDFDNSIKISLEDKKSKWLGLSIDYLSKYFANNLHQQPINLSNISTEATSKALKITAKYDNKEIQESYFIMQQQGALFEIKKNIQKELTVGSYIPSTLRISLEEDANRYGKLDSENKTDPVLIAIKLIEPKIQSLSVISLDNQPIIHAAVEGIQRKIPVNFMGDGVTRLMSIILIILSTPKGIVLIDEIENGIHHSKLLDFWRAIQEAAESVSTQIIATTHSYECLLNASEAFKDKNESEFSFIRIDRNKKTSAMTTVRYSPQELHTALESEFEVR